MAAYLVKNVIIIFIAVITVILTLTIICTRLIKKLKMAQQKIQEIETKDEFTGLYKRSYFFSILNVESQRAIRYKRHLSIVMIDVDHFKQFNDKYGYRFGDHVLHVVSYAISKNCRTVDVVARYSGEEFIMMLPEIDKDGALVVGEKIRKIVEEKEIVSGGEETLHLSISIGISSLSSDQLASLRDDTKIIQYAEEALYKAKGGGGNRVEIYR